MTLPTKPLLILATLIAAVMAFAACSNDEGFTPAEHCLEVPESLIQFLEDTLIDETATLRAVNAIHVEDPVDVWMVFADIEGPNVRTRGPYIVWGIRSVVDGEINTNPSENMIGIAHSESDGRSSIPDILASPGDERSHQLAVVALKREELELGGECVIRQVYFEDTGIVVTPVPTYIP